jgi:hypothetical protein
VKTPLRPAPAAPLLALALALAAAGCGSSGATCETSALCDAGSFCFEGRCVSELPAGSFSPPGTRTIAYGGVTTAPYSSSATCPPTNVAPIATAWAQDFPGPLDIGETVSFVVPSGTASVNIHIQGISPAPATVVSFPGYLPEFNYVVPARVSLPNGQTLYEFADAFSSVLDPSLTTGYFAPNPWSATFSVPASHRLSDLALAKGEVPAGTWTLTLEDLQSGCALFGGCSYAPPVRYRVTVIAKPGPYASTGRLRVAFYFASNAVSAATASGALLSTYQRLVGGVDRLLNQAGIAVDDFTFFDLPPTAVTAFSTTDINGAPPCSEMARLFSLAQPGFDGVHLFLVDSLVSGTSGIVGLTGSIPGPSGIPGAVSGGIVMSLHDIDLVLRDLNDNPAGICEPGFDLLCDADFYAYVSAHEIGHWLGLYHPTERSGDLFDPLDDTATCGCSRCGPHECEAPYPPGMATAYCMADQSPCGGGRNLMFWLVDPSLSRGDLTREQGFVMRANPAVKWVTP